MEVADDEWRGMILFGFYIGQRLGDIASLTRQKLDLERAEIKLRTDKTGRLQILPLAAPLLKYVKKLRLANDPNTPLFPRAFAIVERQGRTGNLSNQFHKILVAVGLAEKRSHHGTGKGRNASRKLNDVSFHSLRHTATTQLKAAGISDAIAREFVGHDSEEISNSYTHIPTEILREAAKKLPDIFK